MFDGLDLHTLHGHRGPPVGLPQVVEGRGDQGRIVHVGPHEDDPVIGRGGRIRTVTGVPVWSPMPVSSTSLLRVRWFLKPCYFLFEYPDAFEQAGKLRLEQDHALA